MPPPHLGLATLGDTPVWVSHDRPVLAIAGKVGRRRHGRFLADAVLSGPVARGSSPVRIDRGGGRGSPGVRGPDPVGEGAGYAGRIVSAAGDGLRTGRAVVARYARLAD